MTGYKTTTWRHLVFEQGHTVLLFFGIVAVLTVMSLGIFDSKLRSDLADPEKARGIIMFLCIRIYCDDPHSIYLVLLDWGRILIRSLKQGNLYARLNKAKDVLAIVIGVLGTILGFYFGSPTRGEVRMRAVPVSSVPAPGPSQAGVTTP